MSLDLGMQSVLKISNPHFMASNINFHPQVPLDWEEVDVTPIRGLDGKIHIPQSAIDSVNTNKIGLKGKHIKYRNV